MELMEGFDGSGLTDEEKKFVLAVFGVVFAFSAQCSVGINTFKSRWGSCDNRGLVQFNWKVIIAPSRVVDYLVVHELCHLKQHNHSPKFWKCVESVFPDYQECKEWLKMNGRTLEI